MTVATLRKRRHDQRFVDEEGLGRRMVGGAEEMKAPYIMLARLHLGSIF